MSAWRIDPLSDSILREREQQVARHLMERQARAAQRQESATDGTVREPRVTHPFWLRVVRNLRAVIGHSAEQSRRIPVERCDETLVKRVSAHTGSTIRDRDS